MVGTKFLVQWEEHPTHLATRLGYLLEHQSLVDVTLMCNTHSLKVHRSVLAACSPYFESVLQKQLGNQPLIVLKDMKFSVLKSLVEFMYCGETSVTEENLNPLMEAAKFFEVKGLSSMTKEAIGDRSSTPLQSPVSSVNGITPSGRGGRRPGAGRGRRPGSLPVSQTPLTNPPTESAQILLSLSGNSAQGLQNANRNVRLNPGTRCISKVFTPDNNILEGHKPYFRNGSLGGGDAGSRPIRGGYEPRRRGRRRNPANIAYNRTNLAYKESEASRIAVENLQKEMDGQCDPKERTALDSKVSLWNTNSVDKSPLLASLLSKAEHYGSKIKTESEDSNMCENSMMGDGETLVYQVDGDTIHGSNMKYLEALKEAGLPTDVPILIDNGDGNYITLTEDVLMNVMEGKEEFQFQVTEGTLEGHEVGEGVVLQDGSIVMERKKVNESSVAHSEKKENPHGIRQFVVKEMQATKSDEEDLASVLSESVKKDNNKNGGKMSVQEIINEAVLESLKLDNKEAEMDPDAVVLFEVTENSKVEKYVVSSKEVNVLKALNEQRGQQKKYLQDVKKSPLSPVGVIGGKTKIAEVKLTIGKSKSTKSILSQVLECAQEKLKESNKAIKPPELIEKKDIVKGQSQLVELEFIDGNGEKIEGYQVEGTMITDRQFEEINAEQNQNASSRDDDLMESDKGGDGDDVMDSSKDDDVMNLLTLDQHLSETERIDSHIESEADEEFVSASSKDKDLMINSEKHDILEEAIGREKELSINSEKHDVLEKSCNEAEYSKNVVHYEIPSEHELIIEKEHSLCDQSSLHIDGDKVQNLVNNCEIQNLSNSEVQKMNANIIESANRSDSQVALQEEDCKVMSVEQALEAMMGAEEAMLLKEEGNVVVEVRRENSNIDLIEREDCNTSMEETVENNNCVAERGDCSLNVVEREDSGIGIVEREDVLDMGEKENNIPVLERDDCNPEIVPQDYNTDDIMEKDESSIDIIGREDSNIDLMEREDSNIDHGEREDINIVINREGGDMAISGKDDSNLGMAEREECNISFVEREGSQTLTVESELEEISPVIECRTDDHSLSTLNENSSNHEVEFQEYISGKDEDDSISGSNAVVMEPIGEIILNTLENVEEKTTGLLNDVLDLQKKEAETLEDKSCVVSPTKDVPFAVGLLPLKTALEKIRTIPEHQPRKTRSSSTSKEENIAVKRRNSMGNNSHETADKKLKLNEDIVDGLMSVCNEQIQLLNEEVEMCNSLS